MEKIEKAKLPGGELKGKLTQGSDKEWSDQFGARIPKDKARDLEYAARFWRGERPSQLRETMKKIIESAYAQGQFAYAVDSNGLSETDKEKLSAYRVLANELGYNIGPYELHKTSWTVTSPITKSAID
jgi:hypothetical protein